MREETVKVYQFDELSPAAKERAIEWWRERDEFFDEFVMEDLTRAAALLGVDDAEWAYRLAYSQGDGALFTGRWSGDEVCSAEKLAEYFGGDDGTTLEAIRATLAGFRGYHAKLVRRDYLYSHEYAVSFDYFERLDDDGDVIDHEEDDEAEILYALRCLMRWGYDLLKREYEYQTSDEAVAESITANEMEFTEDGKPWA